MVFYGLWKIAKAVDPTLVRYLDRKAFINDGKIELQNIEDQLDFYNNKRDDGLNLSDSEIADKANLMNQNKFLSEEIGFNEAYDNFEIENTKNDTDLFAVREVNYENFVDDRVETRIEDSK